jgi:hypothetical protein
MTIKLKCRYCGGPITRLPPQARHKTFCSTDCRQAWHRDRAKHALELLRREEAKGGQILSLAGDEPSDEPDIWDKINQEFDT